MKTINIEIPEGYEIDSFDKSKGEIRFKAKPKNVMEQIKTVADVLAAHGLSEEEFDEQCEGLSEDEKAYRIIKLLAEALNEGWTPDWSNTDQYKYSPWFYMGGSAGFRCYVCYSWRTGSGVGSRLCYKSSELAEYAGKNFTEVYKQFMTIE